MCYKNAKILEYDLITGYGEVNVEEAALDDLKGEAHFGGSSDSIEEALLTVGIDDEEVRLSDGCQQKKVPYREDQTEDAKAPLSGPFKGLQIAAMKGCHERPQHRQCLHLLFSKMMLSLYFFLRR